MPTIDEENCATIFFTFRERFPYRMHWYMHMCTVNPVTFHLRGAQKLLMLFASIYFYFTNQCKQVWNGEARATGIDSVCVSKRASICWFFSNIPLVFPGHHITLYFHVLLHNIGLSKILRLNIYFIIERVSLSIVFFFFANIACLHLFLDFAKKKYFITFFFSKAVFFVWMVWMA